MPGIHARLGLSPSSFHRTIECNAWAHLAEGLEPEPETEESREGDAGHWVARKMALLEGVAVDEPTANGVLVDDDMIAGGRIWVREVGPQYVMELPVAIARIHDECWGSPDAFWYDTAARTLHIKDYKYGFRLVEAFENWQLIPYAIGLMDTLRLPFDETITVRMTIVQPRAFHRDGPVRSWSVNGRRLEYLAQQGTAAAHRTVGDKTLAHAKVGEYCLDCPARLRCPAIERAALSFVEFSGGAEPFNLPPNAAGTELAIVQQAIRILEARETGLRGQVEAHLRRGERVPWYSLAPGRSNLQWTATPNEVRSLGALFNKQMEHEPKLITPTQAINKGIDEAVIKQYADSPKPAMKLVRDSTQQLRKVFSNG